MRRGTTPTYLVRITGRDMADMERVVLSFEQNHLAVLNCQTGKIPESYHIFVIISKK